MKPLKYILRHSLHLVFAVLVSTLILYLYEKSQPVSDYITYYGNVTTQNDYHYPEQLTSWTFGASDGPVEIDFTNKLWCAPYTGGTTPVPLANRKKHFDAFEFVNFLPPEVITTPIDTRDRLSQIGVYDAELIRNSGVDYLSWSMGSIRPYEDSLCYISVIATTYTTIFKLPKTIRFNGNRFTYWTNLRPREFTKEDQVYQQWLEQQTPAYQKYIDSL